MAYDFYIVRCSDGSLYCGQTNDIQKRIKEHNSSKSRSAKYTKIRRPVTLVYREEFTTLQLAMKREWQVKKWAKAKKEALISKIRNC
ncbi:hypothetical protein A3A76_05675 [Candidatus Woesebacteria bacterium RIFCSPLOWO2_01_FULL_39_23]|uniref:GIY-YIG domain-containing protein n=1 Tax=Candidatus Woesebacteria bacterium RIFCSPHIGHO2_01_FULL_40_22 TaxID=1802499 RepID=A0A1F7YKW8_9BACT|nr:MAG: hypothetical protein A2141_03635 [Candidatus Woesebacteria bacterium RBG_16_40_11]OGM27943.1 MAG: hypothetical protein A2628_03600 [Candidatus Woesebacteria bacterium RIFCSPHIGHO2_01_FULL_40_22]OGM37547.1 MAG: hypothetical protein A3E41_01825 [Candidatus Woesebacteria bacterium RIFCSPHIGHO2_12_FULL_38_9]OGM61699.1 MAG: hypothetical protein A3A76_05675 [Candidatus Woesebacteria bacterium RIFCSPLOWO2_01_FULL_39_23]